MNGEWRKAMRQARKIPVSTRKRQSVASWAEHVRRALGMRRP